MVFNSQSSTLWLRVQNLRIWRPSFQYFWVVFWRHTEDAQWKYLVAVDAHLRAVVITQGLTPVNCVLTEQLIAVLKWADKVCYWVMFQALRECLTKWMNFKKVSNYFFLCLFLSVCAVWPNPSLITFFLFPCSSK